MENIIKWIKNKLGISDIEKRQKYIDEMMKTWGVMGVDLSMNERDESFIVIATNLNGGTVKVIRTRFSNITEALDLIKGLESRYQIRNPVKDFPRYLKY